jgi:hypothetical protein
VLKQYRIEPVTSGVVQAAGGGIGVWLGCGRGVGVGDHWSQRTPFATSVHSGIGVLVGLRVVSGFGVSVGVGWCVSCNATTVCKSVHGVGAVVASGDAILTAGVLCFVR